MRRFLILQLALLFALAGELVRPKSVRQSLISSHSTCSRRALYYLQTKIRSPAPLAAEGTVFHYVVHLLLGWMREHGETSCPIDVGLEFLTNAWTQFGIPGERVMPISMQGRERLRMLITQWCRSTEITVQDIVGTELPLSAEITIIGKDGPYQRLITGQIDVLLANPARIIDHKSGPRKPAQPRDGGEGNPDGSALSPLAWAQATVYCWLVLKTYPSVQAVEFREWSVMWNMVRTRTVHRVEMERITDIIAAQVAELDAAIDEGPDSLRWTESPGGHCASCPGKLRCPIRKEAGIIYDDTSLIEAARDWIVCGEVRKDRAEFLKGVVESSGPITLPGGKLLGWDTKPDGKRNFGIFEQSGD